jgi:ParB family chromosome partitioning protein
MSNKPVARLGRGLSALLGDSNATQPAALASTTTAPVSVVPIDLLEPGPFQPRGPIAQADLEELTASIKRAGVLQPLLVRPHPQAAHRFQIIAGERRWRASQMAGLAEVPVVIRTLGDADSMAAALIENLQREDLNPVEEARGYRRLIDEFGLTHQALAEALGKSRAHLSNTLRLLGLPDSVLADLAAGRISAGHARALLAASQPEALAREVVSKGLSVRQTEARAAARPDEGRSDSAERAGYAQDPEVGALVQEMTAKLGLRIRIEGARGRGRVVVEFDDLAQLDGILALLQPRD